MLRTSSITIKSVKLLLLSLLIFTNICVFAQRNAIEFDRITVEEGLSQGTVYDIHQDHKGFMWFGTEDGLNRYDGYSFKNYLHKPNDSLSISNNRVISILEDSQNRLWFGTIDGGLNRFNWKTESFTSYKADPDNPKSISINRVMALCEDVSGKIWVGTANGGLNLFDPSNEEFVVFKNTPQNPNVLPSNIIRALMQDSKNNLYVGTTNGVAVYNRSQNSFELLGIKLQDQQDFQVGVVRKFLEDSNGNIWIATNRQGLIKYNPATGFSELFQENADNPLALASNIIHDLYEDDEGAIWIATYNGLHKYNPQSGVFIKYNNHPLDPLSISTDLLRSVYEDDMGVMWIGTYNHGINKFNRKHKWFTIYRNYPDDPNSFPATTIRDFLEDNKGNIWIGTFGEGLLNLNTETEEFQRFLYSAETKGFSPEMFVTSTIQDQDNNLWIGTSGGLFKFNPRTGYFRNFRHNPKNEGSLSANSIRCLYIDKNNDLWVGTLDKGIDKLMPDGSFKNYSRNYLEPNTTISQDRIISFFEDNRGNFWVGTSNEGVNLMDRVTETFKHFKNNPDDSLSISSSRILCFFEDSKRRLWIGTGGGGVNLFNYEDETFKEFTFEDGLPSDVVYGILEDDEGVFWLSTNKGLSRFDYTNPNDIKIRNYDKHDGLQNNEFTEGAYLKASDGTMYFGGINNFNAFNPKDVKSTQQKPEVYITGIKVTDRQSKEPNSSDIRINLLQQDSLEFSHAQNSVTIHFTGLYYPVPEKVNYKYMLEGFESSWIQSAENLRQATYTNLKPGEYTFRVLAANPDGVWNTTGDTFHFTIRHPFWSTWWFYVIVILIVSSLVYIYILLREERLKRVKQQLEDMVTVRTQEISEQSQEIMLQAERLQQANEEIRATSDALSEQNDLLQAKNNEITIQRNELEEQKNSLANLAWELQDKNEEIERQKDLLAQQKKEITDSIMYAQRIQHAVLPTPEQIKELFPEFFIFNRPKSIVSGDFYWATRIGKFRIVAVVDCTGHGVPGGFMSMLGVLMLNEVISLRRITDPGQALNLLRQNIISVLHQKGEITDAADGMDLSLCIINDDDNTMAYAGANSSMIIFNPNKTGSEALTELRSDRMPIAYHLIMKSFTTTKVKLEKNSVLFLYSDGLVDQFGGTNDKKFQHTKLREFVLEHHELPLETQGIVLEQQFDKWKGENFQVDDVMVLGLKI